MSEKYLIIRQSDGRVVNTIVWDGITSFSEPGCDLVLRSTAPVGVDIGWTFNNNVWSSPEETLNVPASVTMRQARLALLQAGLLDNVEAAISIADKSVQIEWEYSNAVERNNSVVKQMSLVLGLTDQQIDELFVTAQFL